MTADERDAPAGRSLPAASDDERAKARDRMRRKLTDGQQRHDADYWARLRERLDLPARTA
jgi:hypothetical protein